ncbi:5-hydroxytryptamine receptor 3A-like [Trachinotus anak]|uniref:5-hydroxytryptamine receptor 3A-like n=1 Tax=Trachinotus anak TaxID=443729 RepID=UPI0039F2156C
MQQKILFNVQDLNSYRLKAELRRINTLDVFRQCFSPIAFTVDGMSSKKVCSYQDVLDYLNLTTDNSVFKLTRPVLDHTHPTVVELDIILYAILAVIEKTQTFIPFVWATMMWNNEHISWDPAQFCGITQVSLPRDMLWKPDLFIYEMVQKDESPQNPYMYVSYDGTVTSEEDIKVVSTCRMDVHKFPFDTQRCNISIGSAIHSAEEIQLLPFSNSSRATQFSREVMKTQGEWEFLHLSVNSNNFTYEDKQWEQLIYTFTIRRRPLLHVINFLLPILFFLSLDVASFFISDHRGEKLGFKVTVLLAISVLLLILNDILPSMSNRTPLIATYCIVIFALMLLSLLETILVTYLMEKDSASREKLRLKDDKDGKQEGQKTDNGNAEEKRQTYCLCISKVSEGEKQHETLPLADEVNISAQSGEYHVLLLILEELKELQQTLNLHLSSREARGKSTYWASRINRGFFIFYITTVSLFLSLIFNEWNN